MLKNKIALVTGGGRGIGRATALLLGRHNAHVIVSARTGSELGETARMITDAGGSAQTFICDMEKDDHTLDMFEYIGNEHGRLDILVNCAGVFSSGLVEDTSLEEFRRVLEINTTAVFLCCREGFKLMKAGGGAVVNVSSLSGVRGAEKFPGFGAYIVSKFGVVGLTEALAVEGKPYGIRANAVCPGAVDTEMLRQAAPDLYPRLAPEEVARTILYLASPKSTGITGISLEMYSHLLKE